VNIYPLQTKAMMTDFLFRHGKMPVAFVENNVVAAVKVIYFISLVRGRFFLLNNVVITP